MRITHLLLLETFLIIFTCCLCAAEVQVLRDKDLTVIFDAPLRPAAQEVADIYPELRVELESTFGWTLNSSPSVMLVKDRNQFLKMAKNPLTVAFAVPGKNLIVIDHSKMSVYPFSLELTLKHELCHLLLHHHISKGNLPRWFDEGVCQWISGGLADIIMEQKRSLLNRAALRGRFISLGLLQKGFPYNKDALLLAYEESKSFVNFIIREYGKEGILRVLEQMKKGDDAGTAFLKALDTPFEKLEEKWHDSLRRKMTWFVYLSYHLYEIVFALIAIITIFAFIKMIRRKRAYMKEETENSSFH
jgi:hypothetical protein